MAEIVLSALLPIVLEKLASAAFNKVASRSKEIQAQLKKLETSLPKIQALLNDAAEKEIQDKSVKDWLNRLQHMAYDIDDVLDALATDAMHRELTDHQDPATNKTSKVKKLIPTCCTSTSTFSSSSTTRMQYRKLNDITTKLQQLYDERNDLGLTVKDKRSKNINRSYQTSLLPPGIIGRKGEKQILLQKLLADHDPCNQNNFSILPIVGMGGIGKTTLARILYNEPKVKEHFDLKSWACVSDEFDSFNISKVIFEATATEEKKEKKFTDLNLLQEALRDQLKGKRFLLVLDDVWSERIEDWDTLVPPFQEVAPGSKIIITTRKKQLLQQLGNDNPYHLNKLAHEDALSLFAQHSVGATNFDSYPALRSYGEGIVQKCDGLPLALKSLGTSLKTKTDEEDWKEMLNSKIWSLKEEGHILPALQLSYNELSACLKQMFAYSALFPKDYVFEKEDLILLWMADGFLHESTTSELMEMERLGEKYFDELLSRSFFEHVNTENSLFVMHDLMNELATSIAGEIFVRLDIKMKNNIEEQSLKKYRHMSFVCETFMTCKKFEAFERANCLRSFLAISNVSKDRPKRFDLPNKILVDILPQLPLLRALCLSNIRIDEVPDCVGDLKHLRYLNLSQTPITHLPDNICHLYNLQTLIVFGCRKLSKLPHNFLKLRNLRHFDIRDTPLLKNMPLSIGEIKSLQTLSKIIIGRENEFPLSGLKNLKNLRRRVCITGLDKLQNNDQAQEVNLSQMRLSELVVEWSGVFDESRKQRLEAEVLHVLKPHSDNLRLLEVVSYGGIEFPKWVGDPSFHKLTTVHLYKCRNCVFLPPLGQLPSLKKLFIKSMNDVKKIDSELLGNGLTIFPSLEILTFEFMRQWKVWSVNAVGVAVFPCLKELQITQCPNMARWEVWSTNADVGVFPCLEKVMIDSCPNLVNVSLEAPSLRVLRVSKCGDRVLKSLVCVASSVTELSISCISRLNDEMWGGIVQYLGVVEKLKIAKCHEIRNLCEIRGGGEKEEESNLLLPASLRMLEIWYCKNLQHLSCPNNIETLDIRDCEKLIRIGGEERKEEDDRSNLPTSLRMLKIMNCKSVKHLSCPDNIETLDIYYCENLEHLSCPAYSIESLKISGCSSIAFVSFPTGGRPWQKLKSLHIESCNSVLEEELEKQVLVIINNTTNIPPMPQVLLIDNWKDVKSITKYTCFIQLTKLVIEHCRRIESFPDLHDLVSLKHLSIKDCRNMDGPPLRGSSDVTGVWPPKLDFLVIGNLRRPVSEWGPLPTSSLVRLHLWGGFGSSSTEEEDIKSFPSSLLCSSLSSSLTQVKLFHFVKMERISSNGLQHLTSLQHLCIWWCPRLKDLPETLLRSLLSLQIVSPNEELKEKMMSKRGSYWPLLSHIPVVDISSN